MIECKNRIDFKAEAYHIGEHALCDIAILVKHLKVGLNYFINQPYLCNADYNATLTLTILAFTAR